MVKLREFKELTEHSPIEKASLPNSVFISLSQHFGKPCEPSVKIGDTVLRGQLIATSSEGLFSPIHASISGKINAIKKYPHPILGTMPAIEIIGDGEDKSQLTNYVETHCNASLLTPEQLRKIVFDKGVVGLGGAAFPTHVKLNPSKPIETLILNGAECEPYLTCDYRLMLEKTDEILKGLELVIKCINPKKVIIAIEDNKKEAIEKFKIKNEKLKIDYEVKVLKTQYPQGGEKQLIKSITNKEVPSGKLPFDVGVTVSNVATVYAIYEAVHLGKPLYERVITVTGSGLVNPKNLIVRMGTTIKDIINQCEPKLDSIGKIILGGPMMGYAQFSQDTPVLKATSGIIVLDKKEIKEYDEQYCIRCGQCLKNCPMGLMPNLISLAVEKENWELAKTYGALDCIECGVCSYVCPANRNVVQAVRLAKLKLKGSK